MSTLLEQGEARVSESPAQSEGLRRRAARGTIVNAAFLVALAALGLVQRLVVARLLAPSQFGLWNVALLAVLTVLFLKNAGIGDKFVAQREADQELAFQKAFTIDLALACVCVLIALVVLPVLALAYGRAAIIAPGLVLSLAIVGNSLQAPVWIYYREMDYARQRLLMATDPLVAFVVTIALAVAGAGAWSLVAGAVAGAFAGGVTALRASPYRPRLVWQRAAAKEYFAFSWPVVAASGAGMAIAQATQLVATRVGGLRSTGAIGVGVSISGFTDGVDGIVTQTLYPAICAVADRREVLREVFVKSNRLALLWGMPFGVGIALFASDIVRFILGSKWHFAIPVLAAFGVVAAVDQLGFNWTAFLRALGLTQPMARLAAVQVATFALVTVPLFATLGLRGFALGWIVLGVVTVGARAYYLRGLFPGFNMLRHAARAMFPVVPAGLIVLGLRAAGDGRGPGAIATEFAAYLVATAIVSVACERRLLREVLGYVRGTATAPAGRG